MISAHKPEPLAYAQPIAQVVSSTEGRAVAAPPSAPSKDEIYRGPTPGALSSSSATVAIAVGAFSGDQLLSEEIGLTYLTYHIYLPTYTLPLTILLWH